MPATLRKSAYLGGAVEYTFETALGSILAISRDAQTPLDVGKLVGLTLGSQGVSVVAA